MPTQQDIDLASARLQVVTDNYNNLQKQLDKYNAAFETYANSSLETQQRAASVMRQALNEYSNLKAQQQNNQLRIYEIQKQIDYYKRLATNGALTESLVQNIQLPYEDTTAPKTSVAIAQEEAIAPAQTATQEPTQTVMPNLSKTSAVSNVVNNTATVQTPISPTLNRVAQQNTVPRRTVSSSAITASQGWRFPNTTISPHNFTLNVKRGMPWSGSFWYARSWAWTIVWL